MSDSPDRVDRSGDRLGDYELEAELGAGGMATVWRARHVVLDTVHAIKVLDPSYRVRAEARRRFLDEARIQAKHLDHPNIVKVTNIVATPEHAALVMELVDGGNLDGAIPTLRRRPDELRRIMLAVLDAVGHAHAVGIIHRDLKPANVLLARKGDQLVPKVTDFGIAKVSADVAGAGKRSTHGDARMGTLGYMSPEQVRRAKDVTARSDIFSLGAMLYELATGQPPFTGESDYDVMENVVNGRYPAPESVEPSIDPAIAAVIRKALAVDPAQRYASCAEMAAALRAVDGIDDAGERLPPRGHPVPARPPPDRRRALVLGGLAIAGVAFGAGALLVASRDGAGRPHVAASADASLALVATDAGVSGTRTISYAEAAAAALAAQDGQDAGPSVVPLFPAVDAGSHSRLDELRYDGDAPVDAGAHSRLEALLGAPDAGPPAPPPNPCRGTWFFGPGPDDWTIAITSRSTGSTASCGELYLYDRTVTSPGVRTCRSSLRDCRIAGKTLTARFACTYNVAPAQLRIGDLSLTCTGRGVTARTPYGTRTSN